VYLNRKEKRKRQIFLSFYKARQVTANYNFMFDVVNIQAVCMGGKERRREQKNASLVRKTITMRHVSACSLLIVVIYKNVGTEKEEKSE